VRPSKRERFEAKYVVLPSGCWEWRSAQGTQRYGQFRAEEGLKKAHVYSYEMARGPVPQGVYVLHSCDNPPCVNPAHLRLGTHIDNMQDVIDRERHQHQRKLSATQIEAIKALKGVMTQQDIATQFGINNSMVSRILSGKRRSGRVL
jgi:hypothetical protein